MTLKWMVVLLEKIKVTELNDQLFSFWNLIINRCLNKNPHHRYLSAKDLLADLNKIHWRKSLLMEKYHYQHDQTVMIQAKQKNNLYKYFTTYSQTLYPQRKINNFLLGLFFASIILVVAFLFILGMVGEVWFK